MEPKTIIAKSIYPHRSFLINDMQMSKADIVHVNINWRSETVCTGNFKERKDLKSCSLIARNNPFYFRKYTY